MPKEKKQSRITYKVKRPAHKRLVLSPIGMMLVLLVGVFIAGWTYKSAADSSYTVTAQIDAPALTQGAVITYPSDNQTFTTRALTVEGTCEYESYVNLYDNSLFQGVAWRASDGSFSVQMDLYSGQNVLNAEAFNITNQQGPVTPSITVNYNPPLPPISPSTTSATSSTTSATTQPFALTSTFTYQTFATGSQFSWPVTLQGGVAPFSVNVNWGDGQTSNNIFETDSKFTITHTYSNSGYYQVIIVATDHKGHQTKLQLAALIQTPGTAGFSSKPTNKVPPIKQKPSTINKVLHSKSNWLLLAWACLHNYRIDGSELLVRRKAGIF